MSQLDNSQEVNKDHDIINGYTAQKSVPDGNYGGIPGALGVTGTLGKLLGTLGDAFLVGSGRQPVHREMAQQQQVGNALAGFENNPGAAASRVAATGAPGSAQQAIQLQEQQQRLDQENWYRKELTENRAAQTQSQIQARADQATQRMLPYVGTLAQSAKTPQDYARVYQQADSIAKRLDPNSDPGVAFGLVPPEQWQPGMNQGVGTTAGQQLRAQTAANGQQITRQDTLTNAGSRIKSAQIIAGSRTPSQTQYLESLVAKQNAGQSLTPAEQTVYNKYTAMPQPKRTNLGQSTPSVPIAMAGANNPVANGGKPVTPEQARTLPKGTHFLTSDGRWLVR
jgi:hypothetical protein